MQGKTALTLAQLLVLISVIVLVVVVSIVVLLTDVVLPGVRDARGRARGAMCVNHIKNIVVAMRSYATNEESHLFPSDSPYMTGTSYIGADRTSPVPGNGRAGQSRSLFLLVRHDYVGQKAFICPSTADKISRDTDPDTDYDFATEKELSYSYQVQKHTRDGSEGFGTSLLDDEELIVLADRSPISGRDSWKDTAGGRRADPRVDAAHGMDSGFDEFLRNSYNHQRDGQNVGFTNGRVEFARRADVGLTGSNEKNDNIWGWRDSDGEDRIGSSVHTACARNGTDSNSVLDKRRDTFLWP